jgi:hypothetical protein
MNFLHCYHPHLNLVEPQSLPMKNNKLLFIYLFILVSVIHVILIDISTPKHAIVLWQPTCFYNLSYLITNNFFKIFLHHYTNFTSCLHHLTMRTNINFNPRKLYSPNILEHPIELPFLSPQNIGERL